jgi:hypothetical protein
MVRLGVIGVRTQLLLILAKTVFRPQFSFVPLLVLILSNFELPHRHFVDECVNVVHGNKGVF